jgi:cobaltochelatase CobN
MAATALESVRTGHWDASDEIVQSLVKEYVEAVVENGAACCHHTCGNPSLHEFVQGIMSVPGVVDERTAAEYIKIMQEITRSTSTETPPESTSGRKSSGSTGTELMITEAGSGSANQTAESMTGAGEDLSMQASDVSRSTPDNYVEGYEMTKETPTEPENGSSRFSGSDILAIMLVMVGVGAIYIGFWKRRKF